MGREVLAGEGGTGGDESGGCVLEGDPARAPLGLQVRVGTRIPMPEEAMALLGEHGVVCRVGELMPEDLTVEA